MSSYQERRDIPVAQREAVPELVGKTPFEYIRALRLSRAAIQLRDGKTKVVDVAFDFVFDSHEGFTKAFSRQFGLPPKRYSDQTPQSLCLSQAAFTAALL